VWAEVSELVGYSGYGVMVDAIPIPTAKNVDLERKSGIDRGEGCDMLFMTIKYFKQWIRILSSFVLLTIEVVHTR